MDKYFELQYWLTIIGLIITGVFVLICIIKGLIDLIIYEYRRNSKKWQYNYVLQRWERVDD